MFVLTLKFLITFPTSQATTDTYLVLIIINFIPCYLYPWPLVRERTIPTERPLLVDEI
jgi:hypothetical protein